VSRSPTAIGGAVVFDARVGRREIIEIGFAQLQAFAGNLLELGPPARHTIALSTTAWEASPGAARATRKTPAASWRRIFRDRAPRGRRRALHAGGIHLPRRK